MPQWKHIAMFVSVEDEPCDCKHLNLLKDAVLNAQFKWSQTGS